MTANLVPAEDGIHPGVSEGVYHGDRGSLSSSGARALLEPSCPAIFRYEQLQPPKPKKDYDFGHGAHKFVLGEGEEIVPIYADDWRTKDARKQRDDAHAEGKVPLLIDQVEKAQAMANAVYEHPVARALLTADGMAELSGYWHDPATGVRLRYRPDWLCQIGSRIICVDYKSAKSAHPGSFARSAADYGYHQQDAWYRAGLVANEIDDDPQFIFIVQAKTPPFPVTVLRINAEHVTLGARRNREAIDLYHRCVTTGIWPGYGERIHTIDLPSYHVYQQEQELDAA